MSEVAPADGGPYSLRCRQCGEWVPNTANAEMRSEGMYSHSHRCADKATRHTYDGTQDDYGDMHVDRK